MYYCVCRRKFIWTCQRAMQTCILQVICGNICSTHKLGRTEVKLLQTPSREEETSWWEVVFLSSSQSQQRCAGAACGTQRAQLSCTHCPAARASWFWATSSAEGQVRSETAKKWWQGDLKEKHNHAVKPAANSNHFLQAPQSKAGHTWPGPRHAVHVPFPLKPFP